MPRLNDTNRSVLRLEDDDMMPDKPTLLINKATELFAQRGYNAVGIDRIIAEAGVAKMTLYKYFPSKNDLILAVLKERDQAFRASLMAYVDQQTTLTNKIRAVFIWHNEWFKRDDFFGCMFINVAAEFHDHKTAIHQQAAQHKQDIITYLETLLVETYPASAHKLALHLSLLLDGAIVAAQVIGNPTAATDAWEAAKCLL